MRQAAAARAREWLHQDNATPRSSSGCGSRSRTVREAAA